MTTQTDRTRRIFAIEEGVAILARTPPALDALLRGLPDGWIAAHEGGQTWSPFDVVGHLIHGERTDWMPRVARGTSMRPYRRDCSRPDLLAASSMSTTSATIRSTAPRIVA